MPKIDEIDRRTDVVFIVFHFAEEISGVTKVQKLLFLIEQETEFFQEYEEKVAFNFAPYKMGPFSENVYQELQFLLELDAIEAERWDDGTDIASTADLGNKRFTITPKGQKIAAQLVEVLEPEHEEELRTLVEQYNSMSLDELLKYVYSEYPDFASESEIKDEVFQAGAD